MNSRERVLTALKLGQPDMVPFFDNVNPGMRRKIMGRDDFDDVDFAREIHFDAIDFYGFTPPFLAEKGENMLERGLIKDRDDLKKITFPVLNDAYIAQGRQFVEKYGKSDLALFYRTRLGPSFIIQSMGYEDFSYALFDDPYVVETFMDLYVEWAVRLIQKVRTIGFDFAWFADDVAFKNAMMFDPGIYREVFVPRMKLIVNELKGGLWAYHSDGNIMPILEDLLELGMNGLNPIEPGAIDIEELKRDYGHRVCLIGNVDLDYKLTLGTPEEVREEVKQRIEVVGKGGGYIIASSNSLPDYCKLENVLAMRDAIDMYRKY